MANAQIRQFLPPRLQGLFDSEVEAVSPPLNGMTKSQVQKHVRKGMKMVFQESMGFPERQADALARLAVEYEDPDAAAATREDIIARFALQRAVVIANLHSDLAPYFEIVARSALTAFSISDDEMARDGYVGRIAPVLPAVHNQSSSLEDAASSPFFEDSMP